MTTPQNFQPGPPQIWICLCVQVPTTLPQASSGQATQNFGWNICQIRHSVPFLLLLPSSSHLRTSQYSIIATSTTKFPQECLVVSRLLFFNLSLQHIDFVPYHTFLDCLRVEPKPGQLSTDVDASVLPPVRPTFCTQSELLALTLGGDLTSASRRASYH